MEQFEEKLAGILEVDELNDNDILEEFEEWDSLSILSIIALFNSEFGKTISVADVREAKTIGGLKKLIG
ncbi:acyl carrier protein [bacterium]|nr:acyl carrier protein [bacterium]